MTDLSDFDFLIVKVLESWVVFATKQFWSQRDLFLEYQLKFPTQKYNILLLSKQKNTYNLALYSSLAIVTHRV